ncbi:MAG TPA: hypothetical protein VJR23_07645 [Candidatus Acidoferrales bacterium]|nr:hypothetical protein [Candidatus Acidoferrales bacterium]
MKQNPSERLHVLVVWEPILPTDWFSPGRLVKSRIADPRVTQFWDTRHLVALSLSRQIPSGSFPLCCRSGGNLWDDISLYPPDMKWQNASPQILEGPVVDSAADIARKLSTGAKTDRFQ